MATYTPIPQPDLATCPLVELPTYTYVGYYADEILRFAPEDQVAIIAGSRTWPGPRQFGTRQWHRWAGLNGRPGSAEEAWGWLRQAILEDRAA